MKGLTHSTTIAPLFWLCCHDRQGVAYQKAIQKDESGVAPIHILGGHPSIVECLRVCGHRYVNDRPRGSQGWERVGLGLGTGNGAWLGMTGHGKSRGL